MPYHLFCNGCNKEMPIDENTVKKVLTAKDNLITALGVEERYDLLISTYKEFEMYLLSDLLNQIWHKKSGYNGGAEVRCAFTLHMNNYLSSFNSYIKQMYRSLQTLYGKDSEKYTEYLNLIKDLEKNEIDYMIIKELRNYIQHRGTPIHGQSHFSAEIKYNNSDQYTISNHFYLNRDEIDKKDRIFKILADNNIPLRGSKVNIIPYIKKSIRYAGKIQKWYREQLKNDLKNWRKTLQDVIGEHIYDESYRHCLHLYNENRKKPLESLFLDFDDRRIMLEKENIAITKEPCAITNIDFKDTFRI